MQYTLIIEKETNLNQAVAVIKELNSAVNLLILKHKLTSPNITALIQFFAALPNHITSLDLSENFLYNVRSTDLELLLAAIPPSISSLNLSTNCLARHEHARLVQLLAAIPTTITSLDLSDNLLHTLENLVTLLATISAHIVSLNLSKNLFDHKTGMELAKIFTAIPATVSSLNLSQNNLHTFSVEKLDKLKDSLPHIKTITLSYSEIQAMTPKQRQALKAVFTNIEAVILVDGQGTIISNPLAERYAWELRNKQYPPSLLSWCAFYADKTAMDIDNKVPMEVNEIVKQIPIKPFS
ncbi:leucine-rich repeat-containing protein (substrate of the Dot/Icm secretion system) [Legionella beliardensis]|uniref:Leucine-rich repeat-containing protein (Substrate of the Dot/Icm secretion system) n=1 Tax=Legionella beliardensis TaxID=91822 RepID=A0A378I4C1_9GAMM|nr:hypothetical protein [Legionella beliardensis]STX29590.1 leucine-rich repeat-containing protein (substrate of the Dot/Icm secretion system) [Legionella beliardensis]